MEGHEQLGVELKREPWEYLWFLGGLPQNLPSSVHISDYASFFLCRSHIAAEDSDKLTKYCWYLPGIFISNEAGPVLLQRMFAPNFHFTIVTSRWRLAMFWQTQCSINAEIRSEVTWNALSDARVEASGPQWDRECVDIKLKCCIFSDYSTAGRCFVTDEMFISPPLLAFPWENWSYSLVHLQLSQFRLQKES